MTWGCVLVFLMSCVWEGHDGLCKAPTRKERERLRGEEHLVKFIDFVFERGQVECYEKGRRRLDVP